MPAGAGIHDRDIFFPGLPSALADVGGRLVQLMALVEQMQAGPAPGADAAPAAGSANALSGSTSTVDDSLASSLAATEASEAAAALRASSRKLKWADGQGTPRAEGADGEEGAQADEGSADSGEESAAAAAQGEKALRKGFRRRTWAGPAWLEAIAAGKVRRWGGACDCPALQCSWMPAAASCLLLPSSASPPAAPSLLLPPSCLQPLTTALRKQLGPRGTAAAGRRRVVGMVEEPSSSGDEGSTPFNLGSSEDELEESEGGVVDRRGAAAGFARAASAFAWACLPACSAAPSAHHLPGSRAAALPALPPTRRPQSCLPSLPARAACCRVYLKHRAHRVLAKAKAKQAADGASGAADS